MKSLLRTASFAFVAALIYHGLATPAFAQRWFNPRAVAFDAAVGGPLWWGGAAGGGTSTANYLFGVSQVIRAHGEYNELTSRAALNYEAARSTYLANKKEWTETYFAMREVNEARRRQKIEQSKYSKEVLETAARGAVPRRLSIESLDPVTGKLLWPEVLQEPEFARPREIIDQLFEIRATTSGTRSNAVLLDDSIKEMVEILKANIERLPVNEYIAARKFLDSLAYTARV